MNQLPIDSSTAPGPTSRQRRRRFWMVVLLLVAASGLAAAFLVPTDGQDEPDSRARIETPGASAQAPGGGPRPATGRSDPGEPERRLVAAYEAVVAGRAPEALRMAADLVAEHPEFALAQALYADLLSASTGQPMRTAVEHPPASADGVQALRHEATARIAAASSSPPPGHVPAQLVALPATLRHVIAVDVSRQRLYLLENRPEGLRLLRDYYVSVGSSGAGKQIEGDRRTPLGIYWITQAVTAPMRDPRLGAAALRINYPNAWDRSQGRTGSGLYIHGVPSEVMSRPPLSTDGCVAMANPDILDLHRLVEVDSTPVVIARRLRWLPAPTARELHRDFLAARDAWMAARARSDSEALPRWYVTPTAAAESAGRARPDAASQSIFAWDYDDTPLMVVTGHRAGPNGQGASTERQYWSFQQGRWRILLDEALPSPAASPVGTAGSARPEGRA